MALPNNLFHIIGENVESLIFSKEFVFLSLLEIGFDAINIYCISTTKFDWPAELRNSLDTGLAL